MGSALRLAPALLLFGAGTALGASSFGPGASARIPAGHVQVTVLQPARRGVGERELVLSLDGGGTFPVRLTGEIGPGDLEARWRVPALPTDHAILALREGDDGAAEEIVASSAEFTILPSPDLPAEELRFRDGEWKTREADAGRDSLPAPSLQGAGPERCERLIPRSGAFEEPARALPDGRDRSEVPGSAPAIREVSEASPPVSFSRLYRPLRE